MPPKAPKRKLPASFSSTQDSSLAADTPSSIKDASVSVRSKTPATMTAASAAMEGAPKRDDTPEPTLRTRKSLSTIADSTIVTVVVGKLGEEQKVFHWHKSLISKHSPILTSTLAIEDTGNDNLPAIPSAKLPDEEVETFDIITEWLYKDELDAVDDDDRLTELNRALRLYTCALRYQMEALQNAAMDRLCGDLQSAPEARINPVTWLLRALVDTDNECPNSALWDCLCACTGYYLTGKRAGNLASANRQSPDSVDAFFARGPLAKKVILIRQGEAPKSFARSKMSISLPRKGI